MEKQIEEMAKDIHEYVCKAEQGNAIVFNSSVIGCHKLDMAKHLIQEQNYRKQVQGQWLEVRIVRYNGTKPYTQIAHQCSNCKWLNKHSKGWNTNYCPNCSAKMKGN